MEKEVKWIIIIIIIIGIWAYGCYWKYEVRL